jgi:hypothetical protein
MPAFRPEQILFSIVLPLILREDEIGRQQLSPLLGLSQDLLWGGIAELLLEKQVD